MPKIPTFGPPASEGGVWHADKDGGLEQVIKPPKDPAPGEDEASEPATADAAPAATSRRRPATSAITPNEEPA